MTCEHDWEYTEDKVFHQLDNSDQYRKVVCNLCNKSGREIYRFEGTEEVD